MIIPKIPGNLLRILQTARNSCSSFVNGLKRRLIERVRDFELLGQYVKEEGVSTRDSTFVGIQLPYILELALDNGLLHILSTVNLFLKIP